MSKKSILAACLMLSFVAMADPPPSPAPTGARMTARQERRDARREQRRERFEHRAHLAALLRVSTALNLTDAQSLRFGKIMSRYEAQRSPYRQQIFDGVKLLRRASRGDASVYKEVQPTLRQMLSARAQLQKIDVAMYQELSKGLSPQQQAKLALVLARLPMDRRAMAGKQKSFRKRGGF